MRKALQPKPTSRNSTQRDQRLAMLANGWTPIPCEGKNRIIEDWPRIVVDAAQIDRWDSYGKGGCKFAGTGVRIEAPLFVLDLDIKDQEVMNAVLEAIEATYPQFYAGALWRDSGAVSLALFSQVSEPVGGRHSITFARVSSAGAVGDGGPVAEKAHIETYGGGTNGKYFAAFGPHAVKGREYGWQGPSPVDRAVSALPVFPADQVGPLHDLVEQVLGRFMEPMRPARDLGGMRNLYDLSDGMPFILVDGRTITLVRLEAELEIGTENGIRGTLSEQDYQESDSKARCHAFRRERNGRLMITDFYRDVNHYYEDEAPAEVIELDDETRSALADLFNNAGSETHAEAIPIASDPIVTDIDPKKTYANAVNWLARNVAWFSGAFNGRGGVTSIHPTGEFIKPVTLPSLRQRMMSYCWTEEGPRGGIHVHNPIDAWSMLPETDKVCISGVRMRPELPRPIFSDAGLLFVNRYSPPRHPANSGSIAPFEARMVRLIPDAAERAWVWNWLATKVQHPEWRMVGLAMVAREHGTGRGLFAETLQLVLGETFVVPLPYDAVTGNSKFNAEVEGKLLIYVNEARHGDSHKFGPKGAAREALRVFIEPNHRLPFRVEPKGVDAYFTRAAISTMIFANSIKAVPIDDEDRRTAVIINGPQMSVSERDSYQAWMLAPENIGALYRHLRAFAVTTDTTEFDPYLAPPFIGRDQMIDANKTSLDRAWALAIERLQSAADLYAMCQVVDLVVQITRSSYPDYRDLVQTHTYEHGHRIGRKRPKEQNWRVRYGSGEDNRQAIFAFDDVAAKRWTSAEPHQIKAQLLKAQKAVDAPGRAFNKLLSLVPKDGEAE